MLNIVREQEPIARVRIAEIAGFEPGTVTRILQQFLRKKLVYEAGLGASTPAGGRRPRYVHLNPAACCAIGVDIGAVETVLALSDLRGELQSVKRIRNTKSPEQTLASVIEEISSLVSASKGYRELGGIGVSLIGLIDVEQGTVLEGENLGWPEPVEIGKLLRSKIKDIPLYFESGARLAAMGEIWFGGPHLSGIRDLVFVDINEGVGAGIILNGQLYRGFRNGAGEFGHVCVDPNGPKCSCGSNGCLEVFASDLATVRRYVRRARLSDDSAIDVKLIVELANKGDATAIGALKETARCLGLGLAPIIYSLSPEAIVIGGKLVSAWSLIEQDVWASCAERVSKPYLQNTKIVPSTLRARASLMGAIALVLAKNFAASDLF